MGSLYTLQWCLTHRYQHLGGTWHIPSSVLEGKNSRTLKRGVQQVPPNCFGLSTKPHGVTSYDFTLNKLKPPLHIICLGLIYMSTRVSELRIKFLKRYTVNFSLHKTRGDVMYATSDNHLVSL